MPIDRELLFGVILPFGLSLVLLAILGGRRWGVPVSLAAAYLTGHLGLVGWPGMPPSAVENWTVALAAGALLVGLFVSNRQASDGATWLGRLLLTFAIINAVLAAQVQKQWDKTQTFVWTQAIVAIVLLLWWAMDELAERAKGATVPWSLALTAGAAASLPLAGQSPGQGKLLGVLALVLAGAGIVGCFRKSMSMACGGIAVAITLFMSLWLCCTFYTPDVPQWAAVTIALAPLLTWVRITGPVNALHPILALLLTLAVVAIPLGVASYQQVHKLLQSVNYGLDWVKF